MKKLLGKMFGYSPLLALTLFTGMSLLLISCGSSSGGTPAVTYSISGTVTSGGTGLSGVTMTLSGAGSATVSTDANGNYTFTSLANGNYIVTPGKTGFTFTPANSPQTVSGADIPGVNFTATAVQVTTFTISGSVTSSGTGLAGVTMTLNGAGSPPPTTNTDASGNYSFAGLTNGNYAVTPVKTGFTFTPASSQQTVNGANIPGVNFTAPPQQLAKIVACPANGAGATVVQVSDFVFSPANVTVNIANGGVVEWENSGPSLHTATSGTSPTADGTFNTGNITVGGLATNAPVCVQFLAPGSYPYFCSIHTFMTGTVTVH